MKKNLMVLIACLLMLAVSSASATVVQIEEQVASFDVKITLPEGAEVITETTDIGSSVEIIRGSTADSKPRLRLTIAESEELNGRNLSDFTQEEKDLLVSMRSEEMEEPTYVYEPLPDGNLLLILEENTETDDFAWMITVYDGCFISLYMHYQDYDKLTMQDFEEMYEVMQSLVVTMVE